MQQSSLNLFFSSPRASSISSNAFKDQLLRGTKSTPRRKRKLPSLLKSIENGKQTIIDVGQKGIGMEHCVKCGMVYSLETPSDVKQHERFHTRFTETANFRVSQTQIEQWKSLFNENIEAPISGALFGISSTSTATLKRKIETIITKFYFIRGQSGSVWDYLCWGTSGFPDLTIWNFEEQKLTVVEVKGPNDKLSTKQQLWLDFFKSNGVRAVVCHVLAKNDRSLE